MSAPLSFKLWWGAWLALALALALPLLGSGDALVDELIQAATAWRMVQGSVLYQDLHAFAGPLPQLLLAPLYALLGPSLWAARLEVVLASGASLALLGLGIRRLGGSQAAAWWGGAFFVLACLPAYRGWYHHWLALPLALGALQVGSQALLALATEGRVGWRPWLGAGFLAGLAAACTQSTGLAIALALAGALALACSLGQGAWRSGGRALAFLAAGALSPWALLGLGFATQGAAPSFYAQTWWWPFMAYRSPGNFNDIKAGSDLPNLLHPTTEALSQSFWVAKAITQVALVAMPWLAALLGLAFLLGLLHRAWRQAAPPSDQELEASLWAFFLLALVAALSMGRGDLPHHAFIAPVAFAWCLAQASGLAKLGHRPQPTGHSPSVWEAQSLRAPAGLLVLVVLAAGLQELRQWRKLAQEGRWGWPDAVLAQDPTLKALKAQLPPGAPLVAFPEGGAFYLLGGGRPATPFLLLTPQSYRYQSPEDYQRFASAWRQSPPEAVVLTRMTAAQAVAEWGGQPSLEGYRLAFQGPTRLSGQWVPAELWLRTALPSRTR